jgi:PAS domain-containing protein
MMPPGVGASSAAAALLRTLWAAPTPATLQGADHRLLDVNDAYAALVGLSRSGAGGPRPDRPAARRRPRVQPSTARQSLQDPDSPDLPLRRRLLDAQGRERWFTDHG